MKHTNKQYWSF